MWSQRRDKTALHRCCPVNYTIWCTGMGGALTAQNRARLWHPQTILVVREKHTMLPHRFDRMWHVSWPELVVWMQKFSLKYISGRLSFGRVDPRPKRNATWVTRHRSLWHDVLLVVPAGGSMCWFCHHGGSPVCHR